MLEKLAKQTAVYGVATIVVRFLSYLLTPYYTRIFEQGTYGVVTDIYALIPLALTLLTMGMGAATRRRPNGAFSPRRGASRRSPRRSSWPSCSSAATASPR